MREFRAKWLAPTNVTALTTTRVGGVSTGVFAANNLALHVGDNPEHVRVNRQHLRSQYELTKEPVWLEQTHSVCCVVAEEDTNRAADAVVTRQAITPLAIMTADCLPIMLCNQAGNEIAAIHSGWRGLANGIVENTLAKMNSAPEHLLAWIGPGICGQCFEVGGEVKEAYVSHYPYTHSAFKPQGDKYLADLPHLAALILGALGVSSVCQSAVCTHEMTSTCYSYRRDGQTGRLATLIWFT